MSHSPTVQPAKSFRVMAFAVAFCIGLGGSLIVPSRAEPPPEEKSKKSAKSGDGSSSGNASGKSSGKPSTSSDGKSAMGSRDRNSDAAAPATGKKKPAKVDMKAVPADEKEEKKVAKALGEKFKLKHTLHYSVFYDTSEEDLKIFAAAIEKTYRSCVNYTRRLGFEAHQPKHKMIIYYFDHHKDYSAYSQKIGKGPQSENTPGLFFPDLKFSMFYNFRNTEAFKRAREAAEARVAEIRERLRQGNLSPEERRSLTREISGARIINNLTRSYGGDVSEETVQHEVAHQVLWAIGFHNDKTFFANPRWLAEGTAMMFEPISTGSSANFGAVNKGRLEEFRELVRQKRLIPLRDFVSTHNWFGPSTIGTAYPQAWGLTHYLNRTRKHKVAEYAALINQRPEDYETKPKKELADFEKCFGKLDDQWVEKWLKWMEKVNG